MAKIIINYDKCKGCELCTSVCPKKILEISKHKLNDKGYNPVDVTDMDKCIGCAMCAKICPDCVIIVEK